MYQIREILLVLFNIKAGIYSRDAGIIGIRQSRHHVMLTANLLLRTLQPAHVVYFMSRHSFTMTQNFYTTLKSSNIVALASYTMQRMALAAHRATSIKRLCGIYRNNRIQQRRRQVVSAYN